MEKFYAHTRNKQGERQELEKHLLHVARRAAKNASKFRMGDFGYAAGLLHDIGKFNPEFQQYLERCEANPKGCESPKIAHSVFGSYFCKDALEYLRPIISGHHAGIYAMNQMNDLLSRHQAKVGLVESGAAPFLSVRLKPPDFPGWLVEDQSAQEVCLRFLFSCLVDADSRDTAIHSQTESADEPAFPSIGECWSFFQKRYASEFTGCTVSAVNQVRKLVYDSCVERSIMPKGVFRLTAPTGSGKTYALLAFALGHAVQWKLQRVIIALPYTSIIDQNAKKYRAFLPEGALLEHHSAFEPNPTDEDPTQENLRWREATTRWDHPVIITTTVQLFESLFSNKRSRCRKLHNIANSVIVIDEAQTLPAQLLEPTVDMLRTLMHHFGVSILLSTATQPALGEGTPLRHSLPRTTEIIESPAGVFEALDRVEVSFDEQDVSWDNLASDIRREPRILVILNTRKDAVLLWNQLKDLIPFHLSTLMCPIHRKAVLDEIECKLKAGKECRVISTQVVEAGVDLDFPVVYRAFGPLDRIVQASGRCNREGATQKGQFRVFLPAEGGMPPQEYSAAAHAAKVVLSQPESKFQDIGLYERFFKLWYRSIDADKHHIQDRRRELDFPAVHRLYTFFQETRPVLVTDYPSGAAMLNPLLEEIKAKGYISRSDWQTLQQSTISLSLRDFKSLSQQGLIEAFGIQDLTIWRGRYDPHLGVSLPGVIDPADLVVGGE